MIKIFFCFTTKLFEPKLVVGYIPNTYQKTKFYLILYMKYLDLWRYFSSSTDKQNPKAFFFQFEFTLYSVEDHVFILGAVNDNVIDRIKKKVHR